MDKKRRDNELINSLYSSSHCNRYWLNMLQLTLESETCGLITKKFDFLEKYGLGELSVYIFDGLQISFINVNLKEELNIKGIEISNQLEFSFLIEGEQVIKIKGNPNDLIYESQESYLVYLENQHIDIYLHKKKHLKELKISMNDSFIQKHKLNESFEFKELYSLKKRTQSLSKPICIKTQQILAELLIDTKQGLFKRLFLESKVLELLSLQMETSKGEKKKTINENQKIIKKVYEVQTIINNDLHIQFTIPELSQKIGVNDSILKKEFKRVFGKTIFEYALNKRINESKKLLDFSDKPIYEISELVGYKNATHFSAAFKKLEGVTPKKYRDTKK